MPTDTLANINCVAIWAFIVSQAWQIFGEFTIEQVTKNLLLFVISKVKFVFFHYIQHL